MTFSKKQTAYSKKQQAAAILKALATKKRDPFGHWLQDITPYWTWTWKYQNYVRSYLDKITSGEINKLMLFLPPRHGKSEMVTVRYPIYRLQQNKELKIIIGAYNQTLANKFSRKSRRLAQQLGLEISQDRKAVEDWEIANGGGIRAIGVGGGITGQGGDLVIIDDPVKSREESRSKAYRDRAYEWYRDDLYTRQEPNAAIILIMTRWHEDDLAGRILNSEDGENWEVLSLPAEAERNDPLGRPIGDALCPERFDLEALGGIKKVLGRSYYALYQQTPREQEGDIFKRSWFEVVREVPAIAKRVRYWDLAATKDGGDFTVGTLMAYTKEGLFYVEDIVRGQWSSGERDKRIKQAATMDVDKYGNNVKIWIEQEPGSSGIDASNAMIKKLVGYPTRADRVTGDKKTRADPFAAQCEAGNMRIKQAKWNEDWFDEITSFDNGQHDDQVDSASGAFAKLSTPTATGLV